MIHVRPDAPEKATTELMNKIAETQPNLIPLHLSTTNGIR